MERRQLGLLRNAHAHALARRLQERLDLAARPAGEPAGGERVVVERAAPDRGAAVVARAAADHRGARELDAPAAIAVVVGVAALVRLGQPGGVEHVGRPAPVGVAAEVGTGLEHEDGLVRALGEQAGERGARRASPDDQRVDALRQRLHAHKATRCGRNICESAQVSGALLSGDSIRLNQAMAIARHKTRQRELREARALVRRVQRGDARAFELLYATYEGRIYRFCHRLTGRAETAAALVELTFARALANLPEGGLETLDVPAYLYATARTLAFERNGEPLGSRGAAESEVSVANERLSAQERAVLALRDLERRPDDEIAAALDVDEADVPGLVGAARLHLLAELRPHGIADTLRGQAARLSAHADAMPRPSGGRSSRRMLRHAPTAAQRCSGCARRPSLPLAAGARAAGRAGVAHWARARPGRPARPSGGCRPPGGGGRQTLAAVAMGGLAIPGGASRSPPRTRTATRSPLPPRPRRLNSLASPTTPASGSRLTSGVAHRGPATRSLCEPPTLHHAASRRAAGASHRRAAAAGPRVRGPPQVILAPESPPPRRLLLRPPRPPHPHPPPSPSGRFPCRSCRRSRPRTRRPPRTRGRAAALPPEPPPPPQTTTA